MKKSVNEGVMSDLNIIAKESRDYKTFIKSVEEILGQKVNELPVENQEWIRSQYSVAKMRAPKDQSIRETKYNNKTKMKKSQLKNLREDNGAAVEVMRDKYLPLFNKHGIKLKNHKIGSARGNKTLILYPESPNDFKTILTSLEKAFGSGKKGEFENQKPFKAAGRQYKITYDLSSHGNSPDDDNGVITIMPLEIGDLNEINKMKKSQLKELIKEAYLEYLREEDKPEDDMHDDPGDIRIDHDYYTENLKEEDDADIEDIEDDFDSAEPAVAQDGESKNQESAPRKRINFENRELEMLVDVNKNATKKGIKIQFLSDDELSKEERTKLVSSLQTYLDEGLAKFVKGAKLNVDSDQDVPNKTKTVGFTIKIGDVFGLVSKVFANRGDDEEEGGEVDFEAEETEETEELQELRRQIRGFLKEEQMEMSFKTFEDVKNDMSEFPGFQEIAGGFSLPIEGIMGDALGGSYEFTENPDQTVKVTKVDGEGNELSSKFHPIDTIVGFLEKY